MNLSSWEKEGLTLLEALTGIFAPLAAAKNPAYAGIINAVGSAIQTETSSVIAGNAPTLHDQSVATVATAAVAAAGTAVLRNTGNASNAALIGAITVAGENAVAGAITGAAPAAPASPAPTP